MSNQKTIKLVDYIPYPFLIPNINLDFNICKDNVVVKVLMIVEPKLNKKSELILKGSHINLISISSKFSFCEQIISDCLIISSNARNVTIISILVSRFLTKFFRDITFFFSNSFKIKFF